jgi:hypothetical protein
VDIQFYPAGGTFLLSRATVFIAYRYELKFIYVALGGGDDRFREGVLLGRLGSVESRTGLTPFLDLVVVASDLGVGNPDAASFRFAFDHLGPDPACWLCSCGTD